MAAGLVVPIAGPYIGTWDSALLGTQNDDGFVLLGTWQGQEINATDAFGMTLVEAIYRGLNWRVRMRGLEFNRPGMLQALQAFGAQGNQNTTFAPSLANVGDRYSKFAKTLILNSVLADPPTMPDTLTAFSAIVAPQNSTELLFTSKMREVPFEFVLLPYLAVLTSTNLISVSFTTA